MDYFAGLDVSVKDTSVCIVDDTGKITREVRVASEPDALLAVLRDRSYRFKRIGLEAGPLSQWLFSALAEADLPVICVETRHMRAVLKAQINKIRWGVDASSDRLRQRARCSSCGNNGATIQHPGWGGNDVGFLPFPVSDLAERLDSPTAGIYYRRMLRVNRHHDGDIRPRLPSLPSVRPPAMAGSTK
jgi:Transposase